MDSTAIFKLSYGVFFLGCEYNGKSNVCVVNTVAQVTQEPLKLSVTILKSNLTHDYIIKAQKFSVGVMGELVSLDLVNHYGAISGRDIDKLARQDYTVDALGNPLIDTGCIATYCCKVVQTIDLGTHTLFIADLVDASTLSSDEPLTYNNYRLIRSGNKKPGENTQKKPIYQCNICHYVYDGDTPFEELPDDYICPICKRTKSAFEKV